MSESCPLCDQPIDAPSVALKGGGRAHLACAEQQAAAAWRRRRMLALLHLALIACSLVALARWAGPAPGLIVLALAWAALHARVHARFWHYALRGLRRLLRGRC